MYSPANYAVDLKKAAAPIAKEGRAFGKSLLTLDVSKYMGPCFRMVAWFVIFIFVAVFLTGRRLTKI